MVEGCGPRTSKALVICINILVFLSGITIAIASGVVMGSSEVDRWLDKEIKVDDDTKDMIDEVFVYNQPTLVAGVVAGLLMALCGFLGCAGAIMENRCILGIFITFLVCMAIISVVVAGVLLGSKSTLKNLIQKAFDQSAKDATTYESTDCESFRRFAKSTVVACCGTDGTAASVAVCKIECTNKISCPDAVYDDVVDYIKPAVITVFVVLVVEILAAGFSCYVCIAIGKENTFYY